jgi:hypothetical protein
MPQPILENADLSLKMGELVTLCGVGSVYSFVAPVPE